MKKILEYKVVSENCYHNLRDTVNLWIERGWQPLGGIGVKSGNLIADSGYFQAMVRYEGDPVDDMWTQ